jgi:membrane peptidoglycan carboxypeptidase
MSSTPSPRQKRKIYSILVTLHLLLGFCIFFLFVAAAIFELHSSWIQSWFFSSKAKKATYSVEEGANPDARFPGDGPYDMRLGYSRLGNMIERANRVGFEVVAQARVSPDFQAMAYSGFFAPYREKDQAGLALLDARGSTIFENLYPREIYPSYDSIPAVVRDTLLYIENRELLSRRSRYLNPAIEWDRLAWSLKDLVLRKMGSDKNVPGASTLATQIEKFRHSPEGITASLRDKYLQMYSSSLRAYLDGPDTVKRRREIVTQFINSIPLAAINGYGEVMGLSDGLWAWYGTDLGKSNKLLRADPNVPDEESGAERARIYRQILSLFLAQRRPSYYLASGSGQENLAKLTDQYLRRLMKDKAIPRKLGEAALKAKIQPQVKPPALPTVQFVEKKAQNQIRSSLLSILNIDTLYELDRLDLTVSTSINMAKQKTATDFLQRMSDEDYVRNAGFRAENLLDRGDPSRIIYSFTLSERTQDGNYIRIQTDNFNGPFNINEGSRIELGSTAKLRTLITYLELIEKQYNELSSLSREAIRSFPVSRLDALGEWVRTYRLDHREAGLKDVLEASLERKYSASPKERFITGGGSQTFANFDPEWNRKTLTVSEGFQNSVNLVWVRVMRDIVKHLIYRSPDSASSILEDDNHPARQEYLARFAQQEGGVFVERFFRKYTGLPPESILNTMVSGRRLNPIRMAWAFRAVTPMASPQELQDFLEHNTFGTQLTDGAAEDLYRRTAPEGQTLSDLGYLASVHPLELWVARYLLEHRGATRAEVLDASRPLREEAYQWLYKTGRRNAQDIRIRSILEMEAFSEVLQMWKRLGYPYDNIVSSLGTSIGSSGDRPAALADLIGILLNDGVKLPSVRIDRLQFAKGTPFEATLQRNPQMGIPILSKEVSSTAMGALLKVVEEGTGRRIRSAILDKTGAPVPIGGKTGTGDNRFRVFAPGGKEVESYPVNRTSTFVFFLGNRYFGVITAYVPGPEAGEFVFTSALPLEILRRLLPELELF